MLYTNVSVCHWLTVHSPVRNTFQPPRSFGSSTSMFSSVAVWALVVKYSLVPLTVISSYVLDMAKHAVEWCCACRPNRDINSLYCILDRVMEDARNRHETNLKYQSILFPSLHSCPSLTLPLSSLQASSRRNMTLTSCFQNRNQKVSSSICIWLPQWGKSRLGSCCRWALGLCLSWQKLLGGPRGCHTQGIISNVAVQILLFPSCLCQACRQGGWEMPLSWLPRIFSGEVPPYMGILLSYPDSAGKNRGDGLISVLFSCNITQAYFFFYCFFSLW